MKHCTGICTLTLAGVILLTGCGKQQELSLTDVVQALERQTTVSCTVKYTLTMDAQLDGVNYEDILQVFTAEVQTDLQTGNSHVIGELATQLGEQEVQHYNIEAYGGADCTYYRYNDFYYTEYGTDAFLKLVELPSSMESNGSFQRQAATDLVYGAECSVFDGTGLTDNSAQAFYCFLARQPIDLSGCAVSATLRAYRNTGLPADLKLEYNDLADLNISVNDQNGNSYCLNTLSYEMTYHNYGVEVATAVPDDFRNAALAGLPQDTERVVPDTQEGTYCLYNDTKDYFVSVGTPEYMRLDEDGTSDEMLSFYYNYAEDDVELINYTIYNDFSLEQQAESSDLVLDGYRKTDTLENVRAGDVQSMMIGSYKVYYRVYQMDMIDETGTYKIKQIDSWMAVTGTDADTLAVEITEYNGSETPTFIDTETELEYAYGVVYGVFDAAE